MKIGELFVDLDFRDGGAINKLTNFSIKFLALKNGAEQLADVFDNMFGSVIDGVVGMENLNKTTGFSIDRMQKWKAIAEQNNVAFSDVISSLKGLQSAQADIMMGKGNIEPFNTLNIDMNKPRDVVRLMDEIRVRIMEIKDIGLRRNLLQQMHMSENLLVLFHNFNGYFDKNIQLTEEERKAVYDLNREWIALKQTVGFAWDKVWAGAADSVSGYLKSLREVISEYALILKNSESLGDGIVKVWETVIRRFKELHKDDYFLKGLIFVVEKLGKLLDTIGYGAGYGIASAFNVLPGWLNYQSDPAMTMARWNKPILEERQRLIDKYGRDSQEVKDFMAKNKLVYALPRQGDELDNILKYGFGGMESEFDRVSNINPMLNPMQFQNVGNYPDAGNRTNNFNTQVTVNTSQPADENMGRQLGNGFAKQVGNVGYLNNN